MIAVHLESRRRSTVGRLPGRGPGASGAAVTPRAPGGRVEPADPAGLRLGTAHGDEEEIDAAR